MNRAIAFAATTAATIAVMTAAVTAATGTAHGATISRCKADSLTVSLVSTGTAAGSAYYRLNFRSDSTAPCTLGGYPGVSFRRHKDSRAHPGLPAERLPGHPVTVTLWPGQSATALLKVADYGNWSPGTCKPVRVAGLRVYPPNDYESLWVRFRAVTCSARVQVLFVGAVRIGS